MSYKLDKNTRMNSMHEIHRFMEECGHVSDTFYMKLDVVVSGDKKYLYENVTVNISHEFGYGQYKVAIMWEEDKSQVPYKQLGLHGYYGTNFQEFSFGSSLNFHDGDKSISILVP